MDRDRNRNDNDNTRMHVDLHVQLSPLEIKIAGGGSGQDSTAILAAIQQLVQRITSMSAQLDALTAEVERNTTVDQSVITLLNGLAAQIQALKNDPVKLQKLADDLRASNDATAAAVVANTPAEESPPA